MIFLYNFRCRTRIAGGFMIRDYVANQSKDNNKRHLEIWPFLGVFSGVPIEAPHTLQVNYNTINSMNLSNLFITLLRIVVL